MQVSSALDGGQSKPPSERVSPDAESRMVPAPSVVGGVTFGVIPVGAGSALGFTPDEPPAPPPELLEQPSSAALASAATGRSTDTRANLMKAPLARSQGVSNLNV